MSDERVWLVLSDAAANTAEQACWDAYYAQRLAALGRRAGESIDSYMDGSPAPAVTRAYVVAERAGGLCALPVDDHVRAVLRPTPSAEKTTAELPAALATRVAIPTFGATAAPAASAGVTNASARRVR